VHQVGDQTKVILRCTVNQTSRFRNIVSVRKVHPTHTHTDGTDIRLQTARFYNKYKSTDPSLVTWRSAVCEPPEDSFMRDRNM